MAQPRTFPINKIIYEGAAGFTLLEMLCVLAIISFGAALVGPSLSNRGDSGLRSLAVATAAVLKFDRNAAVKRGTTVSTRVDAAQRLIRSGASGRSLSIPADVRMRSTLAGRCSGVASGGGLLFFPSGFSCGGVITFERLTSAYEVRVNWYTGLPEVVSP
jgi:general secretion pathway protein H